MLLKILDAGTFRLMRRPKRRPVDVAELSSGVVAERVLGSSTITPRGVFARPVVPGDHREAVLGRVRDP